MWALLKDSAPGAVLEFPATRYSPIRRAHGITDPFIGKLIRHRSCTHPYIIAQPEVALVPSCCDTRPV